MCYPVPVTDKPLQGAPFEVAIACTFLYQ